jgi:hypothetical protein
MSLTISRRELGKRLLGGAALLLALPRWSNVPGGGIVAG